MHHAIDELPDGRLPLRRAEVTAEVLAHDDVRGELAPGGGDLHVLLLEDELARLVADGSGPDLPGDLVVRMDAGPGPAALEREATHARAGEPERVEGRSGRSVRLVPERFGSPEGDLRAELDCRAVGDGRHARGDPGGRPGGRLAPLRRAARLCDHRDDLVCGSCHLSLLPHRTRGPRAAPAAGGCRRRSP